MNNIIKKLEDFQLESFDTELVVGDRWDTVTERLDEDFPSAEFSFLDIGGGNGRFADRLLEKYTKATGTVLDNSDLLLSRNEPNERKTTIHDSVENLGCVNTKYDLICVHWLLHHLVSSSYTQTRRNQLMTLQRLPGLLTARGRVSLYENTCEGWLVENWPGRLIYYLTSSKWIAPVTRRMGANTGGVGICYLSKNQWLDTIREADLQVLKYREPQNWIRPLPRPEYRVLLNIRDIRVAHFWCNARAAPASSASL